MKTRAIAIAFVYAVGTLAGGAAALLLFGALIAPTPAQMSSTAICSARC